MLTSVQHRRVVVGTISFLILVTILFLTLPASSVGRVPKLLRYKHTSDASTSVDVSNQDLSMPTGSFTYDNIAQITSDLEVARDPCEGLALPEGGKNASGTEGTLVLVTGGAGFIGSNLVDRLLHLGYKVRIFDNLYTGFIRNVPLEHENVEFFFGDILNRTALQEAIKGVDYVFHLAAMSKVVPSLKNPDMARFCLESNALGSWNVLEEARLAGHIKKVIYAASSTYYGNAPPPHKETMAPDFLTPYSSSKYEGELQMQTFDQLFGVPTVSTRFFMVYGPRQPTTGAYAIVTGVFAKEAADGKPLTIEGDGSHSRDFIHVSDIVEGLILAQQSPTLHGEVINLGTGSSYSVQDLADLVSKDQVKLPPREHDLVRTLADTCKMKKLLQYQPKTDFIKEMSYMVKATKEGNVFTQDWFTISRALSAPHLLPAGSPEFGWPKEQNDLDALLVSLQHVKEKIHAGEEDNQRLVTVLPLTLHGLDDTDLPALRELLLNTVYTLVRYGNVVRYIVAATNDKALAICTELNLPCLDVRDNLKSSPALVDALLSRGYDVHYAVIGNSYASSVPAFLYSNSNEEISSSDVIRVQQQGDFFVRLTDETRHAFSSMDKNGPTSHLSMLRGKSWPNAELSQARFEAAHLCDASVKQTSSYTDDDGAGYSSPPGGHKAAPGSKVPHQVRASHKVCDTIGHRLFVTPGCADKPVVVANATVEALVKAGAFHLSQCHDPEHCDVQQILPSRWIQKTADLATSGDLCS
ncbi:hypothetical protein BDZ85DRAFT_267637 [Elsinoe ampelina]|uniref:NAD-dependent epimerase/dehydratase domain-containing protein n=1 Tax=Elsinoe ampelina TaxID=302913 RepID=A0A6A6G3P4_9PEZI|nr:hypothetical protein BDZ85DRAFT_267637 [Elsinoe ampelina]